MNLEELSALVAGGESEQVEFKRTTGELRAGMQTVCAMLNGALPGFVFFGVGDGGAIAGQGVSTRTLEEIANELRRIEPPAFPRVDVAPLGTGKSVIVMVTSGGAGLYSYDGRPYHRIGPTTSIMPKGLYPRRLMESLHTVTRWETAPAFERVTIADLDEEESRLTLENAIQLGRLDRPRERDTESILRALGLIVDDRLINAAVALYGASPWLAIHYPQLMVRMARFRGTSRLADFDDNRQEWGHAFLNLRRAERFLREHVPIAGRVPRDSWVREDRPRYPPRATREAIANAICHRDYTIGGGSVALAVYDDRLEITNSGHLPFGLTPEALTRPHESQPWNPTMAWAFYRAGIIEKWGVGTLNILDWCAENGSLPPVWEEWPGETVVITFRPAAPFDEEQLESELESELESGQMSLEQRVLVALGDEALSKSALAARLGQAQPSGPLHQVVRSLVNRGILDYTIPEKPNSRLQRYRITDAGRRLLLPTSERSERALSEPMREKHRDDEEN